MRASRADIERLLARADLPGMVSRATRLRRAGRGFIACCPFHQEKNASFSLWPVRGGGWRYTCHSASCGEKGNAMDWLMGREGLSFRAALEVLNGGPLPDGERLKLASKADIARRDREAGEVAAREHRRAETIWRASRPAGGSVVETYLREARGLTRVELPEALRFLPAAVLWAWNPAAGEPRVAWAGPAMAAAIEDPAGELIGVHLTFLEPDGSAKLACARRGLVDDAGHALPAKKMRGRHMGGAIRLCAPAARMAAGEGIETALSVTQATGMAAWAAGSLNNLSGPPAPGAARRPHPQIKGRLLPATAPDLTTPAFTWPKAAKEVVLLGDGDSSDLAFVGALLTRAARRAAIAGLSARVAMSPQGLDFNDLLTSSQGDAA